jgi:hypothetical protein
MYYLADDEVDQQKLFQGDIFEAIPCPYLQEVSPLILREDGEVLIPSQEGDLPDAWQRDELILVRARRLKVILLSQTCDIHEEGKPNLYLLPEEKYDCQFILFAPLIPLAQLDEFPKLRRNKDKLREQNIVGAFWLPEHTEKEIEESVVYFHLVGAMLKGRDNRFRSFDPKRRLASLRSPYREALAHKFGIMISRVALPSDFSFRNNQAVAAAP